MPDNNRRRSDIDPAFRAVELSRLADAALGRASTLGASYAAVRIERLRAAMPALRVRDFTMSSVSAAS